MLETKRSKILAAIAAVVLGSGVVLVVTRDGCDVKPVDDAGEGESADAGALPDAQGEGEGEGEGETSPVTAD